MEILSIIFGVIGVGGVILTIKQSFDSKKTYKKTLIKHEETISLMKKNEVRNKLLTVFEEYINFIYKILGEYSSYVSIQENIGKNISLNSYQILYGMSSVEDKYFTWMNSFKHTKNEFMFNEEMIDTIINKTLFATKDIFRKAASQHNELEENKIILKQLRQLVEYWKYTKVLFLNNDDVAIKKVYQQLIDNNLREVKIGNLVFARGEFNIWILKTSR